MRGMILAALLAACVAAGPATAPTTHPSDPKADLRSAQASLASAQANAAQDFDNGSGKPLVAEVAAKQAALDEARLNGSAQERLDASSAFNRARKALDDARAGAIKDSKEVLAARMRVATARAAEAQAEADAKAATNAAQAAQDAKDAPMRNAIRRHKVINGMTEDQVRSAMTYPKKPAPSGTAYGDLSWRSEVVTANQEEYASMTWKVFACQLGNTEFEVKQVSVFLKNGAVSKVTEAIQNGFDNKPIPEPDGN